MTPRSKTFPGTVAPVFLQCGPEPDPVYSVVLAGSQDEVPCTDVTEFGTYLLLRHNDNNHKGVQRGYLRWNRPLLERGLVLVEMPGVEGVSPSIRQQAEELISKRAHAVIGITRGKAYFPLVRLAHAFSHEDMAMQAIVSNGSSTSGTNLTPRPPPTPRRPGGSASSSRSRRSL